MGHALGNVRARLDFPCCDKKTQGASRTSLLHHNAFKSSEPCSWLHEPTIYRNTQRIAGETILKGALLSSEPWNWLDNLLNVSSKVVVQQVEAVVDQADKR